MEPTLESSETGFQGQTRHPSRVKAAVAAFVIAGTLSAWGVASVFAASPSPSPAASSDATTNTTGHTCPAHTGRSSN